MRTSTSLFKLLCRYQFCNCRSHLWSHLQLLFVCTGGSEWKVSFWQRDLILTTERKALFRKSRSKELFLSAVGATSSLLLCMNLKCYGSKHLQFCVGRATNLGKIALADTLMLTGSRDSAFVSLGSEQVSSRHTIGTILGKNNLIISIL